MAISDVMSKSLISASSSIKAARMQNGIKKQMEDRAGVLEAEIKQEKGNAPEKQKELEKTEKKASGVENMTMDTLSGMNTDLMKAAKEDKEKARAEKTAEKKKAEKQADEKRANKKDQEKASDSENEEHIKDREPDNELSNAGFVNTIADSLTPSTGTRDPIGTKVDVNA
ncbi:MAG: hypothetical protein K6E34_02905 [Lachnospiraceae bacterium]|nr:hypothetical protein [Lachnospiraceae bacterium]